MHRKCSVCGSGNTLATASLMAGALSEKMTRGGHPEAVLEALAAPGHGVCRLVQEQAAGQHLGGAGAVHRHPEHELQAMGIGAML